ncbi:unnamed protein product [Dibothriocephalus latus]|uniref:Uncharacterized protein n=1 Tax=Dibothriocephalus latus TaxID=60516 RepID=A0A3P7Q7L3_DIBLA|nr:unnamed protein product [Dibothriocephalus latus]
MSGLIHPTFSVSTPMHDAVHHIRTTCPRRLTPALLTVAKAEFDHVLQMGIVRQSESPWAPLFQMGSKADSGYWRP